MNNMTSKRLAFVELTHIFNNQIKLPYSTGCIWSYCRTDKEISDNYSFDVNVNDIWGYSTPFGD